MSFGAEYLVFVSPRSLKTREKYTNWDKLVCLSLYIFWGKCVNFSIFEWWKCQMDFFDTIVNFIIEISKSKHTSLKKYTNWDKLSSFSLYVFPSLWAKNLSNFVSLPWKLHNRYCHKKTRWFLLTILSEFFIFSEAE